jgi:hypothetical protein
MRFCRRISVLLIVFIIACGGAVVVGASSLAFEKTEVLESGELYAGVDYEKFSAATWTDAGEVGNQQISVVKARKLSPVKVFAWAKTGPSSLSGGDMLAIASDFEKENPGWTVIAGINGDYYDPATATPVNAFVRAGDAIKPVNHQKYMSLAIGDSKEFAVSRVNRSESKYGLSFYQAGTNAVMKEILLDGPNLPPGAGKTSFYHGNSREVTVAGARLFLAEADTRLNYGGVFFRGRITGEVEAAAVGSDKLTIATRNPEIAALLEEGPEIRVQKSLAGANNGYDNIIGVGSQPLKEGEILSFSEIGDQSEAFASARHPRSAIGFTAAGDVILAAFDGRQGSLSGVNLREMAKALREQGCVDAFNLDGGGSTQLIIRKNGKLRYLNSPSEKYRRVANAVLIAAPDVYIEAAYREITASSLTLDYRVTPAAGVEIKARRLLVNGVPESLSAPSVSLDFSEPRGIHYFSFEIEYLKDGKKYTRVMYNHRVNIANFDAPAPGKTKPHSFTIEFAPRPEHNGFDAVINFSDPDDTIVKLYLVNDGEKQVALKDSRGYVCKYYNLSGGRIFAFTVEYHYVLSSPAPVREEYPEVFVYEYVASPADGEGDEKSGCSLAGIPAAFGLIVYYFVRKRRNYVKIPE